VDAMRVCTCESCVLTVSRAWDGELAVTAPFKYPVYAHSDVKMILYL